MILRRISHIVIPSVPSIELMVHSPIIFHPLIPITNRCVDPLRKTRERTGVITESGPLLTGSLMTEKLVCQSNVTLIPYPIPLSLILSVSGFLEILIGPLGVSEEFPN